jgi:hypothetical protein
MTLRILVASALAVTAAWTSWGSLTAHTAVGDLSLPPRHSCAALIADELPGTRIDVGYDPQTDIVTAEGSVDYYYIAGTEAACLHPRTAALRSQALEVHHEIMDADCAIFLEDPAWQGEPGLQPDVAKLAALRDSICEP